MTDMNTRIRRAVGRLPAVVRREPIDPDRAARIRDYLEASGEPIPEHLSERAVHIANYGTTDSGLGPRGTPEPSRSHQDDMNALIRGRHHRGY